MCPNPSWHLHVGDLLVMVVQGLDGTGDRSGSSVDDKAALFRERSAFPYWGGA